jgi:pSer/pThr/pTyr-binding forkhead associated (FHA) protein
MERCPACGSAVGRDDEQCASCGATLKEPTQSFPAVDRAVEPAGPLQVEPTEVPVLVVRKGAEVGERFYLDRPEMTVGRDPGSDIFLNDVTVSRRHALLHVAGGEVTVEDAGSLNGTYVNNVSVDSAVLRTGDVLQVGTFQMTFFGGGGA